MQCPHFDADECRSCTLMGQLYSTQLAAKDAHARRALGRDGVDWLPAVASPESGFRNKAKMVIGGTVDAPTLGILDRNTLGVDLRDCALYPPMLAATFDPIARFIRAAGLIPYDVSARRGELKHVVVTVSPDAELMVRFVLRSQEAVSRIRKHLPLLRDELPGLTVVSANIQPEHKAVLEGAEDIALTPAETLTMRLNGLALHLRPGGFFQTNTLVAAALYRQASDWADAISPRTVWDLYCGVGGFALHLASPARTVTGVETSVAAIDAAQRTAAESDLPGTRFLVGDATSYATAAGTAPDLVVVNPPRRGIGTELAAWLDRSDVGHLIYSSCNTDSLVHDLASMPSLRAVSAQVLDMFPHTNHYEVAVLLER
jgi:23S rRNA (uracil747-C5)-methyltransferase